MKGIDRPTRKQMTHNLQELLRWMEADLWEHKPNDNLYLLDVRKRLYATARKLQNYNSIWGWRKI